MGSDGRVLNGLVFPRSYRRTMKVFPYRKGVADKIVTILLPQSHSESAEGLVMSPKDVIGPVLKVHICTPISVEIDILYFGRLDFEIFNWLPRIRLSPSILNDLNCVRNIEIPWDQSSIKTYRRFLRDPLKRNDFRNLDSVLICRGGDDQRLENCIYPTDAHPDELNMDDPPDREQVLSMTLEAIGREGTFVKVEFEELISQRTVPTFEQFKANPYLTST